VLRQVTLELNMENDIQGIAREAGVRLNVTDCRDMDDETMTMLLELEGEPKALQKAVVGLRKAKWMKQLHETKVTDTKTLSLTILERPPVCNASMGIGVVCLECPYSHGGEKMTWQILVRRASDVRALISRLEKKGIEARIASISEVNNEEVLTDRQKVVVSTALSLGYFDFPRKISLTGLSGKMGIRSSTLSQILRSAERKIMTSVGQGLKLTAVEGPPTAPPKTLPD
jgi:hypothetical protein